MNVSVPLCFRACAPTTHRAAPWRRRGSPRSAPSSPPPRGPRRPGRVCCRLFSTRDGMGTTPLRNDNRPRHYPADAKADSHHSCFTISIGRAQARRARRTRDVGGGFAMGGISSRKRRGRSPSEAGGLSASSAPGGLGSSSLPGSSFASVSAMFLVRARSSSGARWLTARRTLAPALEGGLVFIETSIR